MLVFVRLVLIHLFLVFLFLVFVKFLVLLCAHLALSNFLSFFKMMRKTGGLYYITIFLNVTMDSVRSGVGRQINFGRLVCFAKQFFCALNMRTCGGGWSNLILGILHFHSTTYVLSFVRGIS